MPEAQVVDNTPRTRRIVQVVSDLRRGDLRGASVLDLGCAHGAYSLEFARRGASTLGIDGREAWVDMARESARRDQIADATFVTADVRTLTPEAYGVFDVILCLGLLYHLSAEDAATLVRRLRLMCRDFVVIDTQVAMEAAESTTVNGETYSGWTYREHPDGATPEQKLAQMGASLEESFSFWFTRPSLLNLLKDAGFSSVMEVKNPLDNLYVDGAFKVHEDVVTLVAFMGAPVGDVIGATPARSIVERWPETIENVIFERPWTRPRHPVQDAAATPAAGKSLLRRLLGG